MSTEEGDLVLYPFIGSGTTARTAMLKGRKFLGFEIDKEYCNTLKTLEEFIG